MKISLNFFYIYPVKHLKLFENWEQSSSEFIICPHCLTKQHHSVWEICPKKFSDWKCEECGQIFDIEKEEIYHTSKPVVKGDIYEQH